MAEDQYVLSHTADAFERVRISSLERGTDSFSLRLLAMLEVQQGWRCLEIGAGQGSIARWLAERVGPRGQVVATDINPRFLQESQVPNIEVRRHDIRTESLEMSTYDLAHCRAVLMHLREPHVALRRMIAALRMGGWLLVEEADYCSLRAVVADHPRATAFDRIIGELPARVARASAANLNFGSRVPDLFAEVDLTEVGNEGRVLVARGGEEEARRQCMTFRAFLERGFLSAVEYADLEMCLGDPHFSYITATLFAAWGKRAGSDVQGT